jgi:hypothetical protein
VYRQWGGVCRQWQSVDRIEMETDVEIEIEMETQPFSPEPRVTVASSTLLLTPSIHPEIPQPITAKIMSALIRKVLHARAAAEHDKFNEQKTNCEAQGSTTSFRGALKVLSKRKEKGKKTKKQRTSASIDDVGENSQMCLDKWWNFYFMRLMYGCVQLLFGNVLT